MQPPLERCLSNLLKAQCSVKFLRARIGRHDIDFAGETGVSAEIRPIEKVGVKFAGHALPMRVGRDGNTINVNKPVETRLKPAEILAVIVRGFIERDQKASKPFSGRRSDATGIDRMRHEFRKT